jgi:hypothetical protein
VIRVTPESGPAPALQQPDLVYGIDGSLRSVGAAPSTTNHTTECVVALHTLFSGGQSESSGAARLASSTVTSMYMLDWCARDAR